MRFGWWTLRLLCLVTVACDGDPAAEPSATRTPAQPSAAPSTTTMTTTTEAAPEPPMATAPTTEGADLTCELHTLSPGFHLEHRAEDESWGWVRLVNIGERTCEYQLDRARLTASVETPGPVLDIDPLWALLHPGGELRIESSQGR